MGSKRALSNGNEPEEVADMLAAFCLENKVEIAVTCTVVNAGAGVEVLWGGMAVNVNTDQMEQGDWASVLVPCSGREFTTLKGLFTTLLYRLDFAIGEAILGAKDKKRA